MKNNRFALGSDDSQCPPSSHLKIGGYHCKNDKCINENKSYQDMKTAWAACKKISECKYIMQCPFVSKFIRTKVKWFIIIILQNTSTMQCIVKYSVRELINEYTLFIILPLLSGRKLE